MKDIGVQSLPLHKPIILKKDNTLKEAARAMKSNNVGSVLVSDGQGVLKGLITDRDLALSLALENHQATEKLEAATHERLIYVNETSTLKDVVNIMIKYSIRRVPVIHMRSNGRHRCLGIISLDDLVKNKLIDLTEEARILQAQIKIPREKMGMGRARSLFHSQGRKHHSYHTFMKNMELQTTLNKAKAQLLTNQALMMILKRIPPKSGQNLLAQLPHELQMQMLAYISPADRTVSSKMIISNIKKSLHVSENEAKFLLGRFWVALENSLSSGEMKILGRELPKDFAKVFTEPLHH